MKKYLLPLFSLLTFISNAQDIKLSLSEEFAIKDKSEIFNETFSDPIYKVGNFYYRKEINVAGAKLAYSARLKDGLHGLTLHKYDLKMKEVLTVKLEDGKKGFGPLGENFIAIGDKLILLYYKYDKDDSVRLYVSQINPNSLELKNATEIYSYYQKNLGFFGLIGNAGNAEGNKLKNSFSADSSKILISTVGIPGEIYTIALDKDFNLFKGIKSVVPNGKDFEVNDIFIDNTGNRYLTYGYKPEKKDKYLTRGVLVQNTNGKESYINLTVTDEGAHPKQLYFNHSKDNSKVYIYGNYYGEHLSEGVLMSTVDALELKVKPAKLYPYPEDLKKRLYKLDFGEKSKGDYSVHPIGFSFTELNNGSIALCGVPEYTLHGDRFSRSFAGPVVVALINRDNSIFTMIPRSQNLSQASECIATQYNNNVLCLYTDKEKNVNKELSDEISDGGKSSELILVAATIQPDGKIVSRKKIADHPSGSNYYFLDEYQKISPSHFIFCIGRDRVNFSSAYAEKVQMVDLEIK